MKKKHLTAYRQQPGGLKFKTVCGKSVAGKFTTTDRAAVNCQACRDNSKPAA